MSQSSLALTARRTAPNVLWPLAGFTLVVLAVAWVAAQDHASLLGHSVFDSYTLQALAWREGHVALDQNYPWLELAIYQGDYYVSFPPLPAVPMLLLSLPFGDDTPSAAVGLAYFFGGLAAIYALLRRYLPADQATLWLVFVALGGTLLSLAVPGSGAAGGVWFQAQLLGFLLTALAFLLVDGDRKLGWVLGLVCLALAVGCRPFNLIFAPVLLWMLHGHLGQLKLSNLWYLAAPAAVLAVYAAYNAARFGNPIEFGHAYLPELAQAGEGMFVPARIPDHISNILRAPVIENGALSFPAAGGFAVYLTNPVLLIGLGVILVRAARRKADVTDGLLFVTIVVATLMLLSHRTNGGWAYGTRYLCDLLPALVFVIARGGAQLPLWRGGARVGSTGALVMGLLIAFNLYGIVVFESLT